MGWFVGIDGDFDEQVDEFVERWVKGCLHVCPLW